MRNFIYLDSSIPEDEYKKWKLAYKSFIKDNLEITPSFRMETRDYSYYPTRMDNDGDVMPTRSWLKAHTNHVEETYGDYAFDHVFIFIHEDNWRSSGPLADRLGNQDKGISGTNFSYSYGNVHLHYCKWDKHNDVNTLWTSLHEGAAGHPLDSLLRVETGKNINVLAESHLRVWYHDRKDVISYLEANGFDWDRDYVHGRMPALYYLGHSKGYPYTENVKLLSALKDDIKDAYESRRQEHIKQLKNERDGLLVRYLGLLKRKLAILLNKKNGVRN